MIGDTAWQRIASCPMGRTPIDGFPMRLSELEKLIAPAINGATAKTSRIVACHGKCCR